MSVCTKAAEAGKTITDPRKLNTHHMMIECVANVLFSKSFPNMVRRWGAESGIYMGRPAQGRRHDIHPAHGRWCGYIRAMMTTALPLHREPAPRITRCSNWKRQRKNIARKSWTCCIISAWHLFPSQASTIKNATNQSQFKSIPRYWHTFASHHQYQHVKKLRHPWWLQKFK